MDASKPVNFSFLPPTERPEDPPNYKQCSVRGCAQPVAEESPNKMCEICRSRHRVYASTKRARRKLEKAAVNGSEPMNVDSVHEQDSDPEIPENFGEGTYFQEGTQPLPSSLSIANQQQSASGASELNSISTTSFVKWNSIDPRLFTSTASTSTQQVQPHQATSSSELTNALTLPLPRQAAPPGTGFASQNDKDKQENGQDIEEQPLAESLVSHASSGSTRFCSVKGCKAVVPASYNFKMCPPCRTRYRTYGITKRAKWKSEREAFHQEMARLRVAEDERRVSEGLPLLADSPDDLHAWESSILKEKVPSGGTSSRTSPEPEQEPGQPSINPTLSFGYISGLYPIITDPIDYSVSVSPYAHMMNTPLVTAKMCTVSHCHAILPMDYQFKRCEQHRLQNRQHSKTKRFREKAVKDMGPKDGAVVLDSVLLADDDAGPGPSETSATSKGKGKEKAKEAEGSDSMDQQSARSTKPKAKTPKSKEEMQKRSRFSCANDDCHNLLSPGVRWRNCDECRNQDRLRKETTRAESRAWDNVNHYPRYLAVQTIDNASVNGNGNMTGGATTSNNNNIAPVITTGTQDTLGVTLVSAEDDEKDAEGEPDVDSAGEDTQNMQLQSQLPPQSNLVAAAALSSFPITNTNSNPDSTTNTNIIYDSDQKTTWDTPQGNEFALEIEPSNSTHRRGPNQNLQQQRLDPLSPNFNSITKQKNIMVNSDSSKSVKGAFSKFRVELNLGLGPTASGSGSGTTGVIAKPGPVYSGFLPKTGLNLGQVNTVAVVPTLIDGVGTTQPGVITGNNESGKVDSTLQNVAPIAEKKTIDSVLSGNSTPPPIASTSSTPSVPTEPEQPPVHTTAQKKKSSAKGKKNLANSNTSTFPALPMPFAPYGFPTSYSYYPPYFMPPFHYPGAAGVGPTGKKAATLASQQSPSSSSQGQLSVTQLPATASLGPQYIPYPFLPPPGVPLPQVYGQLGVGLPPSTYPYLPPRYTVSMNQNLISGQQPYPTISQYAPTPKTKTSSRKSLGSTARPTPAPALVENTAITSSASSSKVLESNVSSTSALGIALTSPGATQEQPSTADAAAKSPPAFTHFHEFDSSILVDDNIKRRRKRRKVDPNYMEKYRAIHGFDPPTTISASTSASSSTVAVAAMLSVDHPDESMATDSPSVEPPDAHSQMDDTAKVCARKGCHRSVSLGTLCGRCKVKFKKQKETIKRRHRLEPIIIAKG